MASCGTFQKLRPLSLLEHLASCYDSALLKVTSNSVSWSFYIEQGKITYASHSVDPFDRLDCHLRRLGHQITTLSSGTRAQLRLLFENELENQVVQNPDYQAICWLVEQQYLDSHQATLLIEALVKEVIESFLLVQEGNYELADKNDNLTEFCRLDLQPLVEYSQKRLQAWQSLGPQIKSPYQRPYFLNKSNSYQPLLAEVQQKLSAMLKGFSFRHLAILINQDELQLAQSLYPYIVDGTVVLNDPHPPFDQLPTTFVQTQANYEPNLEYLQEDNSATVVSSYSNAPPLTLDIAHQTEVEELEPEAASQTQITARSSDRDQHSPVKMPMQTPAASVPKHSTPSTPSSHNKIASPIGGLPTASETQNTYKIVCVDDSPTMLKELSYFLDDESFSVFTISDSVKALMQIIRVKPDLVLLDVRMSGIDGYELCRLLRNHSLFKHTPIIMVTGNTGFIDRVKARLVGASGYLTKPFTQTELLKMIFRHLT